MGFQPVDGCTRSAADVLRLLIRGVVPLGIAAVAIMLLFFGGVSSPRASLVQSILDMRDGFNHQSAGDVLRHCSDDFRESVYSLDSASFRGALVRIFLGQRDRSDRSFLWQAAVSEDAIEVVFDGIEAEATRATVSASVEFRRRKKPGSKPVWVLGIEGDAQRDTDGRWRFHTASFKTLSGRRPF